MVIPRYLSLNAGFVADLVEVVGRHARLDLSCDNVQHFSRKPANLAHGLLSLGVEDLNLGPVQPALALGDACHAPIGMLDRPGDRPHGR